MKVRELFRRRKIQRDSSRQDLDQLLMNKKDILTEQGEVRCVSLYLL